MSNKVKHERRQIRAVVQELLPTTLNQELSQALYTNLLTHINKRLDDMAKTIKTTLEMIDERSKGSLDYVIRNASQVQPVALPESTPPAIDESEVVQNETN